jgi:hypothetical protein
MTRGHVDGKLSVASSNPLESDTMNASSLLQNKPISLELMKLEERMSRHEP